MEITAPEDFPKLYPVHELGQVVLDGFAQIKTQALGFCAPNEIGVHWLTNGGQNLGS